MILLCGEIYTTSTAGKSLSYKEKKYLKKKISDVVTLGTFCYRDQ